MDNENTTYTMTESEKSFINGLVKSMRKEVFNYLVEVVKETVGKADITLDALENWLGGMQADGISNVEKTLELIRTKQETKWSDYLADALGKDKAGEVTKDKVIEYLCNNREEVKDILETVDIDSDDVPDSVADNFVDDWFSNAYNSDIIEKINDLRDFVKDCIDEL